MKNLHSKITFNVLTGNPGRKIYIYMASERQGLH